MPLNPRQRIEIAHDILAREVYARIDADEKMRLKIAQFLRDRYDYYVESGALLDKKDLAYIDPYLEKVEVSEEQAVFLAESRREVAATERRRKWIIGAILGVLLAAAVVSLFFGIRSNQKAREAELANATAREALAESDRLWKVAETEKANALIAKDQAIASDSRTQLALVESNRLRKVAETEKNKALTAREIAEQKAKEAKSAALAAQARQVYLEDNTTALNLAMAAYRLAPTEESQAAMSDILSDPGSRFFSKKWAGQGPIHSVAYSPSGDRIVTRSSAKAILWDLSGNELVRFSGDERWIHSVAYSPSGDRIVTGGDDGAILWDLSGNELARS